MSWKNCDYQTSTADFKAKYCWHCAHDKPANISIAAMITLRDYQSDMVGEASEQFRRGDRAVLIQSPTGSGKSQMGAAVTQRAIERGHDVFWITHRRELIKQVSRTFDAWEIEHGVISAGFPASYRRAVQICSLDTLRRRLDKVTVPRLIIWDEARHLGARTWGVVYHQWPKAWHLGLDATPQRNDSTGLGDFFQHMVLGPPMQELIDRGFLCKYRLFAPVTPDLSGLHTRMGEYIVEEMETIFDKPTVVGDAVSHYKQWASGKRALVFCVSIEASKHMAQAFREAGFCAVHADGNMDTSLRDQMMADFDRGAITVICNVGLYTDGLDIVGVEAIIQLRPTQSRALHLQMIGRGLRPAPGKEECIIIDACANWQRHGLPTDPYEWALTYSTERKKKTASISVRVCAKCFAASSARALWCSNCAAPFPVASREVAEKEGSLVEITPEMIAKKRERQGQGMAQTIEELRAYCIKMGWNPARAEHIMAGRMKKRARK